MEAGIALKGTEVKSMRAGHANLKDSYIFIQNNEAFIEGMHVSPYEQGNIFNVDPLRKRKLLLHKKEILKLRAKTQEKGLGIVPLKLYFKDGRVKVEIAVVRGKKLYDKRATEAKRSPSARSTEHSEKGRDTDHGQEIQKQRTPPRLPRQRLHHRQGPAPPAPFS